MNQRAVTLGVVALAIAGATIWFFSAPDTPLKNGDFKPDHDGAQPERNYNPAEAVRFVRDRERANKVREAFREAWLKQMAAGGSASANTNAGGAANGTSNNGARYREWPTGPTEDGGDAQRNYIRDAVRNMYFPLARQCYQTLLDKNPKASGRIELSFAIVGDKESGGVVDTAAFDDDRTSIVDPEFQYCMRESMLSVIFDAPPGGKRVTVTYPIEFSNDDRDE